ncbi:CAP domain-containing protein [Glycomyces sp. L485]|uniref:CAP domain-containing protein n=1 Tax=Glycomyces sp. L485 TaxID=2909235 RepID=UPI001F4BB447|nr:CAP domain-containing protein [Glycomyces sp. L485]MCH7231463.1 CAP domain-containing protein [Glycomyces sp. L485]
MSRVRGGRHRNPAENRRRMFLAILLAFGFSTIATSLWALGSPLEQTAAPDGDSQTARTVQAPADTPRPDLQIGDTSIQPQEAEEQETPTTEAPSEQEAEEEEPQPDPEPDDGPDEPEPEPDRTRDQALVDAVNDERSAAGCGALERNSLLDTASRLHAEDMAVNDYFDHISLDGRNPSERAAEQGFNGGVGENIAAGYPDVASVMEGWMNSEGHRANILNCDYDVIGIGIADRDGTPYWVQNFG